VALDQPFFRSLAAYFGSEWVTVCASVEQISDHLQNGKLNCRPDERASRLKRIATSKYGVVAVRRAFEQAILGNHVVC